jgi:hypothetical protein
LTRAGGGEQAHIEFMANKDVGWIARGLAYFDGSDGRSAGFKIERARPLVELAATVVQVHPVTGFNPPQRDSDDDAEFGDGSAFGNRGKRNFVAHGDLFACGEFGMRAGPDDLDGRALSSVAEKRGDVV